MLKSGGNFHKLQFNDKLVKDGVIPPPSVGRSGLQFSFYRIAQQPHHLLGRLGHRTGRSIHFL